MIASILPWVCICKDVKRMKQRWATRCQKCIKRQLLCTARCALQKAKQARGKPLKLCALPSLPQALPKHSPAIPQAKHKATKQKKTKRKTATTKHTNKPVLLLAPIPKERVSRVHREEVEGRRTPNALFQEKLAMKIAKMWPIEACWISIPRWFFSNFVTNIT